MKVKSATQRPQGAFGGFSYPPGPDPFINAHLQLDVIPMGACDYHNAAHGIPSVGPAAPAYALFAREGVEVVVTPLLANGSVVSD